MGSIKYLLAVLLLVFSEQSLALFMPGGVQINSDTVVASNNGGC